MNNSNMPLLAGGVLVIGVIVLGGIFLASQNNSTNLDEQEVAQNTDTVEEANSEQEMSQNIVELAVATDDLSTLVAAVQAGDLVDALSGDDMLTVFAPTNEAFAEIQSTVDTLLLPENKSDLQNVLQYHVVSGKVMSSDLQDGQEITTLAGAKLTVRIEDGKVYINDSMVVIPDVSASNGVVHVIDKVLVP